MSQEKMLGSAKNGNSQAIAATINGSPEPKSIPVKAPSSNGYLTILVESPTLSSQDTLVSFLKNGIANLKSLNISKVVIRGRAVGQTASARQAAFDLAPFEPSVFVQQTQTVTSIKPAIAQQKNSRSTVLVSTSESKPDVQNSWMSFVKLEMVKEFG